MVIEATKILNKDIVITNTAAREAVEGYEKAIILNNNEEDIYLGLKEIIQNYVKDTENTTTQSIYDNEEIVKQVKEIL